jgi:hypothetical protein
MEMTGEQIIPVSQDTVWAALNNPDVLKACIPGCETIELTGENEYRIAMTAAVGPVKAKFNGKLLLSNINAPTSYSLSFEGSGGAAGFGKGSADVALSSEAGGTKLAYSAKAQVGGKLAQVGSRLIDGVAKKMADDFFVKFKKTVAPVEVAAPVVAAPAASAAPAAAASATASPAVNKPEEPAAFNPMWIVGVVIVGMIAVGIWMGR